MQTFQRILGSGKIAWYRLAAFFISIVSVTQIGLFLLGDWRNMPGWEAFWIAQSLVAGKGYSFPFGHRWLFDFVDKDTTSRDRFKTPGGAVISLRDGESDDLVVRRSRVPGYGAKRHPDYSFSEIKTCF